MRGPFATKQRALLVAIFVAGWFIGAKPEDAPPAAREQVANALRVLAHGFPALRRAAWGKDGSIEQAMMRYAPAKFHPVDEGTWTAAAPTDARCPSDMAMVAGRLCIDRYEAHLVERAPDGSWLTHSPYESPEPGHDYLARSAAGVVPQAYISAAESLRACRAAGKRLCHAVEWRLACGGAQGFAFPYGPRKKAGACHDTGVAPMLVFHASTLKRGWGALELNDPRLNQLEGAVAKTGAFPACVNDFGAFDMVGNLHEWTADPNGTFQGGFWLDTSEHGEGCAYRTIAHPFDYHDYSTGFRCCADPTTG